MITTLVLATSFTPLKRRLEGVVERRFKDAPAETSAEGDGGQPSRAPMPTEPGELADRLARLEDQTRALDDLRAEVRELSDRLARVEGGPTDRARPADRPT